MAASQKVGYFADLELVKNLVVTLQTLNKLKNVNCFIIIFACFKKW